MRGIRFSAFEERQGRVGEVQWGVWVGRTVVLGHWAMLEG